MTPSSSIEMRTRSFWDIQSSAWSAWSAVVSSSRQWSGEWGGDLRPLWVRGGEGWWIMYRWKVKVETKEQRAGASERVYHTIHDSSSATWIVVLFRAWLDTIQSKLRSCIYFLFILYYPLLMLRRLSASTPIRYATTIRGFPFPTPCTEKQARQQPDPSPRRGLHKKSAMSQQHSTTYYAPCLLRYRRRP